MIFRLTIDIERCKGCELCLDACPRQVLALSSALNASGCHFPQVLADRACSGCRRCAVLCPEAAIEIERLPSPPPAADGPGRSGGRPLGGG